MTTDTGEKHLSLRQQVRTLDNLVDAQATTIRELEAALEAEKRLTERNAETAREFMAKAERAESELRDLNDKRRAESEEMTALREQVRTIDAERDKAATLWCGAKVAKAAAALILGGEDGENLKDVAERAADARTRAEQDARIAWDAHAREKAARESWVQAYRDTLTRAEKAEQALGEVVTALHGGNAEGMADCVTAGPQCHYQLPYEACKRLLAVLKSDALQHVHTYAPDTGMCSCGHAEADDSR